MKKFAVIGSPVSQSLSPKLFHYWFDKYGIAAEYTAIEVSPNELGDFIRNMKKNGFSGVNVTSPHKITAIKFLDKVNESNSINTIFGEEGILYGVNTDGYGFRRNIEKHITGTKKAVVLGAGGAAKAIVQQLIILGFEEIIVTNRTHERAEELSPLVADWESRNKILQNADLLVNTTSLGMIGKGELDIDLSLLPTTALVTDIVYNPLITPLLAQAKARGNPTINGLGMLLYQAQVSFFMWFHIEPKVTSKLKKYMYSEIAKNYT